MKLTKEEKSRLISIIKKFESLSDIMDSCERELEDLDQKRTALFKKAKSVSEEIEKIRAEEKEFTNSIIEKYGEFSFDARTLDIIPKNG